jgi:hypothetical protein
VVHRDRTECSEAKANATFRLPDLEQSKTAVFHSLGPLRFLQLSTSATRNQKKTAVRAASDFGGPFTAATTRRIQPLSGTH